jgi:hypothetical protein
LKQLWFLVKSYENGNIKMNHNNFTASFNGVKELKRRNFIYQFIGILILLSMVFIDFKFFLFTNFFVILILSIIVFAIIRLSRRIITIKYFDNDKKIIMITYSKKEKAYNLESLFFSSYRKGIVLQDLNGNLLLEVNKDEWDNFLLLQKIFQEKTIEKKISKSTLKGLFKEILINEIKDPSSF